MVSTFLRPIFSHTASNSIHAFKILYIFLSLLSVQFHAQLTTQLKNVKMNIVISACQMH